MSWGFGPHASESLPVYRMFVGPSCPHTSSVLKDAFWSAFLKVDTRTGNTLSAIRYIVMWHTGPVHLWYMRCVDKGKVKKMLGGLSQQLSVLDGRGIDTCWPTNIQPHSAKSDSYHPSLSVTGYIVAYCVIITGTFYSVRWLTTAPLLKLSPIWQL